MMGHDDTHCIGRGLGEAFLKVFELAARNSAVAPIPVQPCTARGAHAEESDALHLEKGLGVPGDISAVEAIGIEEPPENIDGRHVVIARYGKHRGA